MKELCFTIIITFGQILGFAQIFTNLDFEQGISEPEGWSIEGSGIVELKQSDVLFSRDVSPASGLKFLKLALIDESQTRATVKATVPFKNTYFSKLTLNYYFYSSDSMNQVAYLIFKGFNWDEDYEQRDFKFVEFYPLFANNRNFAIPQVLSLGSFYAEMEGFLSKEKPDSLELEIRLSATSLSNRTDVLFIDNIYFEEQVASLANVAKLETKLFPNPCTSFFSIEMANTQFTSVLLYNLQGQLIAKLPYSAENRYDIGNLSCGVYSVVLANKQEKVIARGKLVKM